MEMRNQFWLCCSPCLLSLSNQPLHTHTHAQRKTQIQWKTFIRSNSIFFKVVCDDMTDKEGSSVPDDLSLLLRSTRPEPQDYVADLDQDKYTKVYKTHIKWRWINTVFKFQHQYKLYNYSMWVYWPGKAGLRTHWPKRSSHSRSGSPPGSGDPAGEESKNTKVSILRFTSLKICTAWRPWKGWKKIYLSAMVIVGGNSLEVRQEGRWLEGCWRCTGQLPVMICGTVWMWSSLKLELSVKWCLLSLAQGYKIKWYYGAEVKGLTSRQLHQ